MSRRHARLAVRGLPWILLGLLSCADAAQLAGGGIGGTGFTHGPIEGFGSIFVGGVEWRTGEAAFSVDGDAGAEKDLSIGMVVSITGELDSGGLSGRARRVEQDDEVEGPVAAVREIDMDTLEVDVLGTTAVLRRGVTSFEDDGAGFGFDTVDVDDVLEIDGLPDGQQRLVATHVEKEGELELGVTEVDIEGVIESLEAGVAFEIGDVRVELVPPPEFDGLSAEDLRNGLAVEVEGVLQGAATLLAEHIEPRGELPSDDFEDAGIEGFVTDFVSVASFRVNGLAVDASNAVFEDGGPGDLEDGARVEVEGSVVDGVLQAEQVEFEDEEDGEFEGEITAFVDLSDFDVAGFPVDASSAEFENGVPGDLAIGVVVRIEGEVVDGVTVAEKVRFRDDDDDAIGEGARPI